jgi:hypothetical protein
MALDVGTNLVGIALVGIAPVERYGNHLEIRRVPPAAQPIQVIGAGCADPAPRREEVDQRGARLRCREIVRFAREGNAVK